MSLSWTFVFWIASAAVFTGFAWHFYMKSAEVTPERLDPTVGRAIFCANGSIFCFTWSILTLNEAGSTAAFFAMVGVLLAGLLVQWLLKRHITAPR